MEQLSKGWYNDRVQHSLAARGLKSNALKAKPMPFPAKYKKDLSAGKKSMTIRINNEVGMYKPGDIYRASPYKGKKWDTLIKVRSVKPMHVKELMMRTDIPILDRERISREAKKNEIEIMHIQKVDLKDLKYSFEELKKPVIKSKVTGKVFKFKPEEGSVYESVKLDDQVVGMTAFNRSDKTIIQKGTGAKPKSGTIKIVILPEFRGLGLVSRTEDAVVKKHNVFELRATMKKNNKKLIKGHKAAGFEPVSRGRQEFLKDKGRLDKKDIQLRKTFVTTRRRNNPNPFYKKTRGDVEQSIALRKARRNKT